MLNIALSHDIDRIDKSYQTITHALRNLSRGDFQKFIYHFLSYFDKNNSYWGFDEIMRIESSYGIRSTNFFLNESIIWNPFVIKSYKLALGRYKINDKRIVEIIKTLDQNGWEVGLHGSYNSYKNGDLLKKEKTILEKILGHQVIGIRQHYLNLDSTTWSLQKECGLKYDSSFGFSDDIGFKDDHFIPFHPIEGDFFVFPQVIMDTPFMKHPNKWQTLQDILELAEQKNSVVVINWHNNYFNEQEFPGYKQTYIKIIEECLNKGAIFKTLGEYYNQKLYVKT